MPFSIPPLIWAVTQIISLSTKLNFVEEKSGVIELPYEPYPYKSKLADPSVFVLLCLVIVIGTNLPS